MAWPSFVTTREVTSGPSYTLEDGTPLKTRLTVTASRSLVWDATGVPFTSEEHQVTSELGVQASLLLPVTDQAGWRDDQNNLIDVTAPDTFTHTYRVVRELLDEKNRVLKGSRREYLGVVVPTGATPIDIDLLLPTESVEGARVSIPDAWSETLAQAAIDVSAAQGAASVAAGSAASAANAATAAAASIAPVADKVTGLEDLTTDGRLSEAGLSTTIAAVGESKFRKSTTVLAPWFEVFQASPATAKVALVGPSTVDVAAAGVARHNRWKLRNAPGDYLAGMVDANVLNFGYNGQTGDQITSTAHMTALTAAAPHLVCASGLLINSVRATQWTLTDLTAALITYVERIRAAVPGVPIVLETGNPLLTTDVGDAGFVTPNTEAAAKAEMMRLAHLATIGRWPEVIVRDVMLEVYGGSSFVTHPYMSDQLHPNSTGMDAEVDALVPVVGYIPPAAPGRSLAARNTAPYAPWTLYGREVEEPSRYALVAEARLMNISATFLDIALRAAQRNNIDRGDVIELPGGLSFQIPVNGGGFNIAANGAWTRMLFNAGVIPVGYPTKGIVRIWRRRVGGDPVVEDILKDTSWRYKKIGRIIAGSTTYADVGASSVTAERSREVASDWATTAAAGDLLYVEGAGATPATLIAGQFPANGSNLRLTGGLVGLDYSTLVGRLAVLVGNHS